MTHRFPRHVNFRFQLLGRSKRTRQGKTLLIVLALLAFLGGGGYALYHYGVFGSGTVAAVPLTDTVFRGPFDHIVLEQGEVESSSNIDVVCEVKSRGTAGLPILWVIDEGTYVKTGDKLVELDASALENDLKSQRILASSAEATLISSEATVRTAEIALQEYLEGTYLSERKAILSEIAVAEQELKKAELNLLSAQRLAAKGMLKGLQIEAEQFSVVNAKNVLDSAQVRLGVLDRLTKEKNKVQFESDIEAAKARMKSDQSVLLEEQDKLKEIEEQMSKCIIFSPAEGVVVHNNEFSSRGGAEFVVEQGATVRERQCIIKLPDPTKMQVKAKVNESRITLISDGMAAKVKVGAVDGDMLSQVKKVNKYAEPGSWFSSAVKEYAVYIEVLNPPESIRTGMTAEVRIFVEQIADALQIPVHGIYEHKGLHFALVQNGKEWVTREIKIGATNEKTVTIMEGLSEGDIVALDPRNHLDLMDFPEIEEVSDREALAEIGARVKVTSPIVEVDGPGSAAGSEGGPPGGPPRGGPGGGGGFNPAAMVDSTFEKYDLDSDGKLSSEEIAALNPSFRDKFAAFDSNGDGSVEKAEAIAGMKMGGAGGGRPPQ